MAGVETRLLSNANRLSFSGLFLGFLHAIGQVGEFTALFPEEIGEASLLDNDSVVDHGQTIALLYGREPMRHHD